MLQVMSDADLEELWKAVELCPGDVAARVRLSQALATAGVLEEAASQLFLAARMDATNVHRALAAASLLVRVGRERDAALLLATLVQPARTSTSTAEAERETLEALLRHSDAFVRCHAVRALGRLRIENAEEALQRACADSVSAVRLAALGALRKLRAH